jgi:PAB-dependent poly(A)-specific ribonuclease subunit 3
MDPSWSETGDRYLIKLFRDYVFHQVDESGKPVIDMVHVLTCLNKVSLNKGEKRVHHLTAPLHSWMQVLMKELC